MCDIIKTLDSGSVSFFYTPTFQIILSTLLYSQHPSSAAIVPSCQAFIFQKPEFLPFSMECFGSRNPANYKAVTDWKDWCALVFSACKQKAASKMCVWEESRTHRVQYSTTTSQVFWGPEEKGRSTMLWCKPSSLQTNSASCDFLRFPRIFCFKLLVVNGIASSGKFCFPPFLGC